MVHVITRTDFKDFEEIGRKFPFQGMGSKCPERDRGQSTERTKREEDPIHRSTSYRDCENPIV